jgi:hypothetical protein
MSGPELKSGQSGLLQVSRFELNPLKKNIKALDDCLASLEVADLDDAAAREYNTVRETLKRSVVK